MKTQSTFRRSVVLTLVFAGVCIAASTVINLTTQVTGILPAANGGSGLGTQSSNVIYKGNGTGAIAVSSITDNGTSATSTDTSGYIAPEMATNGTTAGAQGLSQGTTSASAFPCTVANTVCTQAPAAVTSYVVTVPGAAPANNSMMKSYTTGAVESFVQAPRKVMLTSAYTNSTTTPSNITGLSFSVDASTSYVMDCFGLYKAATGGGFELTMTGPASPTLVTYNFTQTITLSTATPTYREYVGTGTSYPSAIGGAISTTTTDQNYEFHFGFTNGTTAGTIQIQGRSAAASDLLTIEAGAYCVMQ